MKKFVFLIIICIFALFGCTNQHEAYNTIAHEFPNAEIISCISYTFVVIDSIALYYVECQNPFNGRITHKQLIKKWQGR